MAARRPAAPKGHHTVAVLETGGEPLPMTAPYPKEPGDLVDALFRLEEEKRRAVAVVTRLSAECEALEKHLMEVLAKRKLKKAGGRLATATPDERLLPKVTDWDALYRYILKTKDVALLHRRVSVTHFLELAEANRLPPGTEVFRLPVLKLNKVKS